MAQHGTAAAPSPYASILAYSEAWPEWQRDALRRIVRYGSLNSDDLKELEAMCRARHAPDVEAPPPEPLSNDHIPGGVAGAEAVSLTRLSGLRHVGQIPEDQSIDFGPSPGLTVIYGENGTGKSGYARVLKKACRARGEAQAIMPNAFAPLPDGPAVARVEYRVGTEQREIAWTDGKAADARLSNVFVFDSFSASAHVGEEGPACFKPQGLDVLPELAKACDTIKAGLQKDIEQVQGTIDATASGWTYKPGTAIGQIVGGLAATTEPERIDQASQFTDTDEKRLAELTATLNAVPEVKAKETTAAANRIRAFAETAAGRATSVDDTAMQGLGEAINEAVATADAAEAAAGPELKDVDLPGSCSDVWRKLWEAAREFSLEHAYPAKEFPVTEAGARCVLCQQVLQPDAIDRYARFNRFVVDETRRRAEAAKAKVAKLKAGVDPLRPIASDAASIQADLDREAPNSFAAVEAFAQSVDARITHAKRCLEDFAWSEAPALASSPIEDLRSLAGRLDARAKEELAAAEPEVAKKMAAEKDELEDKKWLVSKKEQVKAQIDRLKRVRTLQQCQRDCSTTKITEKSGELGAAHVTAALLGAFNKEREALGLKAPPVKLEETRGVKGERRFALSLDGATSGTVCEVASEGEHRCIALAAFLAELSQASHRSALVFDDPVSSLDHRRREAIATRLVEEAKHRQVVVFTHDIAFVCDLDAAIRVADLQIHYRHIERLAGRPGRVLDGLQWDAKSYKEQMKALREDVGKAEKVYKEAGDSEYRKVAMPVVDRIRGACERIIEEKLVNGVLKRHDSRINVKNAPTIAVVTAEQWKAVHQVWKECSNITEAHAPPFSGPRNVPEPARLKEWIERLGNTVDEVGRARGGGATESPARASEAPPATSDATG